MRATSKTYIRINNIYQNILLPVCTLVFLGYIFVLRIWVGYHNYVRLMVFILGLTVLVQIFIVKSQKRSREDNILYAFVLFYIVIRGISLIRMGFNHSILRSLVFEIFYLMGICCIGSGFPNGNRLLKRLILGISILFNCLNCFVAFGYKMFPENLRNFLDTNTMVKKYPSAALFTNPNAAGIFCAVILVLSILWLEEAQTNKIRIIIILNGLFHTFCMFTVFRSVRSAMYSLIITILIYAVNRIWRVMNGRTILLVILSCLVLGIIGLKVFYSIPVYQEFGRLTEQEIVFDAVSTGRYSIWKTCFVTSGTDNLLGRGSLELDREYRKEYVSQNAVAADQFYGNAADFTPHNGYLSFLTVTGWFGFFTMASVLYLAIIRASHLDQSQGYILAIYVLVNSFFEDLLIMSHFFPCLFLVMLLSPPDYRTQMEALSNESRRGDYKHMAVRGIVLFSIIILTAAVMIQIWNRAHVEEHRISEYKMGNKEDNFWYVDHAGFNQNGDFTIKGWFLHKGVACVPQTTDIGLKNAEIYEMMNFCYVKEDIVYVLETELERREDVNRHINDGLDYQFCGFNAVLKHGNEAAKDGARAGIIAKSPDNSKTIYFLE